MNRRIGAIGVGMLLASMVFAQQNPGTLAVLEFQTPKNGMVSQYEQGRKQKAAWHKQQNDSQPLFVWEIVSGESTGTYIVGRNGQHWADLDKPTIPLQADLDEYNKSIGQYVGSLVTRYYDYLPKVSNLNMSGTPSKYSEVQIYYVKIGHESDFQTAIARVSAAIDKTKWPSEAGWYELVNGGRFGEFVLVLPHKNWADFENKPNMKPFREMLKEGLGQEESDSVMRMFDTSIEGGMSQIIEFRQDLSYLPGK
jgi:hypothetical protein